MISISVVRLCGVEGCHLVTKTDHRYNQKYICPMGRTCLDGARHEVPHVFLVHNEDDDIHHGNNPH